jgi:beta-lactamase superfamily II metal-dependent hydrolase
MLKVIMNKAGNGDCISLQTEKNFILIDGGTAQSFEEWKKQIIGLVNEIDTLVITHIDNDHVNGIIKLLIDENCPKIGEVYFNGVEQFFGKLESQENTSRVESSLSALSMELSSVDSTMQIGFSEGTSLSYLLNEKKIISNLILGGEAICRDKVSEFNSGGIKFKLISPTLENLEELRESWEDCLNQKNIRPKIINKSYSKAFEAYLNKIESQYNQNIQISSELFMSIESLALSDFTSDNSLNNKTSLAFIVEYHEKKILFLGDCHVETIESWFNDEGIVNITVDAVKVSHHGSKNNTSLDLLNRINCNKYLISTNGKSHNHPDLETLARIAYVNKNRETFIYINYEIDHIPEWFLKDLMDNYSNVKILMDVGGIEL